MRFWTSSIRVQLTVWHAGVLALIICLFSAGIFFFVKARLDGALDEQIRRDLLAIEKVYREEPWDLPELDHRMGISLFEVVDGERTVYRTGGWPPTGAYPYRVGAVKDNALRITIARDETPLRQTLRTLAGILAIGVPCAVGLAVGGGYVLAGRLLAPVGAMAATARRIGAESLAARLPISSPQDEFGQLAGVFNDTLSRLQDAFEQLRRFTADASHELRTPLTAMRSVGEVALRRSPNAAEYREVIGSMLEEVDRLTRLVENLLTLTRGESGRIPVASDMVDLGELAASVSDSLHVLAEEKHQSLLVEAGLPVTAACDPAILRQGLINLLHNAIKYTPGGGAIRMVVQRAASGEAVIEVKDTGPGIPAADRQRIFERFYRVDGGRSREAGGVGLGLAIARWAVEANGGRIEVESEEGRGALFRIVLPVADDHPGAKRSTSGVAVVPPESPQPVQPR
jgi:heavy metal sensor kinase